MRMCWTQAQGFLGVDTAKVACSFPLMLTVCLGIETWTQTTHGNIALFAPKHQFTDSLPLAWGFLGKFSVSATPESGNASIHVPWPTYPSDSCSSFTLDQLLTYHPTLRTWFFSRLCFYSWDFLPKTRQLSLYSLGSHFPTICKGTQNIKNCLFKKKIS